MTGYLPLIRKDSGTPMHIPAVYVKERLPFPRDVSLETSSDFYLGFRLGLLHSVTYFFFIYRSPSSSLCRVFDSTSSNIDEVFSINPSANVFVFGDFKVHHKDWRTYSGQTDRPGETGYNFSKCQMTLLKWLVFLLNLDPARLILIVVLFWIYFFLLTLIFVLLWLSLHWGIPILSLSQFPLSFHQIHNRMPRFVA